MNRFIAYSGGVESTTMLLLFGHEATPLFADTGWEHRALYEWLERVEVLTGRAIVRVRREGGTLPDYIRRRHYYPSPLARFCTRLYKIEPMDAYLRERLPAELMIGLNYDERDRVGNHGLVAGVRYSYPLIDLKINRAACVAALRERGLLPSFPGYMRRGGCIGCFYKSKAEYARMAVEAPDEADGVAELEDAIQDARGGHYAVRDGIPNMRRFIDAVRSQGALELDLNEAGGEGTPCGVFCRR